jgi:DNA-binding MarR family transcriptional regulator
MSASTQPATEAPPELSAIERLGRSFKAMIAAQRRLRGRETQRPGALSYAQYGLLFGLADACEMSSRDLAITADLSPATVTQMLDGLEAAGLVRRTRSEQDRRVVLTTLTERGQQVLAERKALFQERWQAALTGFSDEELATAAAVLDRLTDYFERFEE